MRSKLLFLILAVGLLYFGATTQAGENLLYNPSMEIPDSGDDAGRPDEWGQWGSDVSYGVDSTEEFLTDAAEARTGSVYGHCRAVASGYAWVGSFDELTPVVPGKQYYIGAWAKDLLPGENPSASGPVVQVDMFEGVMKDDDFRHMEYRVTHQIDIPADGQYHYIEGLTIVIPAEIGSIQFGVLALESSEFNFDDGYIGLTPFTEFPVHDPDPDNEKQGVSPGTTTLSWLRDFTGGKYPQVELYWGAQDPNFWGFTGGGGEPTKIMALSDVNDFDLGSAIGGAISLVSDEVYYWALKYEDPNGGLWGAGLAEGPVWSFDTINRPPVVDAGLHYDRWQDGGASPIKIGIDASYTDDGLPVGGNLTYTWTETLSGGATTPAYPEGRNVEDPNVIFTATGDYLLKLTIHDDDGGGQDETGEDTTLIRIIANSDDRLRAYYELNGNVLDSEESHDGTIQDDPTYGTGQVGLAIELDGTDDVGGDGFGDFVSIDDTGSDPNNATWDVGYVDSWENSDLIDGMTVYAWMKLDEDGWSKNWESIVAKSTDSWELLRDGSGSDVGLGIKGDIGFAGSSGTDVTSGWHQVAGVYDRNTVKFYVDGLETDSTDAGADQAPKSAGKILIGNTNNPSIDPVNDFTFGGLIDQVRIFDAAVPHRAEHAGTPGIVELYRADSGHDNCGGVYLPGDENEDCYITLADFALVSQYWLQCNDTATSDCDEYIGM